MKRITKLLGILITAIFITAVFSTGVIQAQSSSQNSAQGLQITPTRVELNAKKGGSYEVKIGVMNVTAADLVYKTSVHDFNSSDETGSPNIIEDSKLPPSASIVSWVEPLSQISLRSKESAQLVARINIPEDAEPGGHYGVIRFSGSAPSVDKSGVGLAASAAILLLIRVDGDITEKADLASFTTVSDNKQTSFFESAPINFSTRVKNLGNIHVKPSGPIVVKDMFGNTVATLKVNDNESNVLPGSIRRFDNTLKKDWMIGLYSADLSLAYGSHGQALTRTISFWVIPYRIILAALFILVTIGYIMSRLLKVYNRHIINQLKNDHKKQKRSTKKD
jgi:hypothetical protein